LFLALSATSFAIWIQVTASPGLHGDPSGFGYRDFGSLWASGDAANRGLDPYRAYPLTNRVWTPLGEHAAVNLNPPFSVLILQVVARVDPATALRAWQAISAALYLLMIAWLVRVPPPGISGEHLEMQLSRHDALAPSGASSASRVCSVVVQSLAGVAARWRRVLLVLAWQPLWSTIDLGQMYIGLLLPAASALLLLSRYPTLAGCCIGLLVALKPQFILWPVLLAATRQRRPALVGVGVAGGLTMLPAVLGHGAWYAAWADAVASSAPALLLVSGNLSLPALLVRAGIDHQIALGLAAMAVFAPIALVARRRYPAERASAVALVAVMLATPISWVGYGVLLLPIVLTRRDWPESMTLAALALAVPGPLLFWSDIPSFVVYSSALGLLLWALLTDNSPPLLRGAQTATGCKAGLTYLPKSSIDFCTRCGGMPPSAWLVQKRV
jgi:hypothetical protein